MIRSFITPSKNFKQITDRPEHQRSTTSTFTVDPIPSKLLNKHSLYGYQNVLSVSWSSKRGLGITVLLPTPSFNSLELFLENFKRFL